MRTGVQVTGRLGEAKRRSASSGGDRAPDAVAQLTGALPSCGSRSTERTEQPRRQHPGSRSRCEGVSCSSCEDVDRYLVRKRVHF